MIKAIIFDLDGVLVDARELHYKALNRALKQIDKKYVIERDEHLSTYDGLPTRKKLKMLTKNKGLPKKYYDTIWQNKQKATRYIIDTEHTYNERIRGILKRLREEGYLLTTASNSIRESTKMMLLRNGFMEYMEFFISNQDVKNPKPNPEMFLRTMIKLELKPKECVIVEDSHYGRQSAIDAGAYLCSVENTKDLTYEKIKEVINKANKKNKINKYIPKWQDKDLKIIIPLAGEGKSFKKAGYTFPKPLIDIKGKPMIQWVIENINVDAQFIFIVKKEEYKKYNLKYLFNLLTNNNCKIVALDKKTEGAAETVLKAKHLFNDNHPITIINSDQFLEWNSNEFFYAMAADECDGGIVTFESTHPKFSFVKTKENGFISKVAEKKPISNKATAGIYYFQKGKNLIKYTKQMIKNKKKVNNQYFVCPIYNEMINDNKKIRAFKIDNFWSFATPEDVNYFINNCKLEGSNHV